MKAHIRNIQRIARREVEMFSRRPLFLFCMITAPVLCVVFFTSLMRAGMPHKLPAGMVDADNTHISRIIVRILDSFETTDITKEYKTFREAQEALIRGDIYAIFYIPKGTTEKAIANRQPRISFYTNDAYYVPGNLLMRDMRMTSELAGLALTRENLYAKGRTEREAMGLLQPIVIETHPLNNAPLDYSVYLNNMLVPGIIILLILLTTTYTMGIEWKKETQGEWYDMAGRNWMVAMTGKMLPQTIIYSVLMIFMDVCFFRFLQFPCNCGIGKMMALSVLTVLASQGFGIFFYGLMAGAMRLTLCICSLWGILSFSLAGFTYPVTAMSPFIRSLAVWFPLRHYYLIYVNSALNGHPFFYVWGSIAALMGFCLLPLIVSRQYRLAFLKYKYMP